MCKCIKGLEKGVKDWGCIKEFFFTLSKFSVTFYKYLYIISIFMVYEMYF